MTTDQSQNLTNQQQRTRKDLLQAAGRLLKSGRRPTMDEVAAEAKVSRATAYRYFPSLEALLVEAPLDTAVPDAAAVFGNDASTNAEERLEKAEAAMHRSILENEMTLRQMLAYSVQLGGKAVRGDGLPVRQNRRSDLIHAALAPVKAKLKEPVYRKLAQSLALVFGTEAMIVFKDVLRVDDKTARSVKGWALRALLKEALREGKGK